MSAQQLETHDYYRIAAEARCNHKTVQTFLSGKRKPPHAMRAALEAAMAKLGYKLPAVQGVSQ